jgi:hypothetical protein
MLVNLFGSIVCRKKVCNVMILKNRRGEGEGLKSYKPVSMDSKGFFGDKVEQVRFRSGSAEDAKRKLGKGTIL